MNPALEPALVLGFKGIASNNARFTLTTTPLTINLLMRIYAQTCALSKYLSAFIFSR